MDLLVVPTFRFVHSSYSCFGDFIICQIGICGLLSCKIYLSIGPTHNLGMKMIFPLHDDVCNAMLKFQLMFCRVIMARIVVPFFRGVEIFFGDLRMKTDISHCAVLNINI